MATPRLMIVLLGGAALVVAAVVLLATGSWWALAVVVAVHLLASLGVVAYSINRASQADDKADPVTEARIEEQEAERPRPRGAVREREVFN